MTTYHDTPENIAELASLFGMPALVAHGWLVSEGQATDNPTNPLNIMRTLVPVVGYTVAGYAIFASADAGLAAAYQIVSTVNAAGYAAMLAMRGSTNAAAWAKAIEQSPWAGSHYGSNWAHNTGGTISEYVAQHATTGGTPVATPDQVTTALPTTLGIIAGPTTERFLAATLEKLDPIEGSHLLAFDASVKIAGDQVPHGTFLRSTTKPPVLIAAALVVPAITPDPAPVAPPADPYAGEPSLSVMSGDNSACTAFETANATAIAAALAKFLVAVDAWLVAHNEPPWKAGGPDVAIPRSTAIALAASVDASILRVAGYFGPEPATGVSA